VIGLEGSPPAGFVREWRALVLGLADCSYFQSPDWILSWWDTVGGRPPTECATWRNDSGELEAVALLSRCGERLHPRLPLSVPTWVLAGSGPGGADHVGLPALAHRREEAWRWVRWRTMGAPVMLRNLDPAGRPDRLPPGARLVERSACPRLDLGPELDGAGFSAKLRKQLRAYDRRLEREGVTFRWEAPSTMTPSTVDLLFSLHERRRQLKEVPSSLGAGHRALNASLVARALEAGDDNGPAAIVAERHGELIGMLYGFMWGGVFSYYQTGWDPSWSQHSLGTVLVEQAISLAARNGAEVFDFLRGAEAYKYRFGGIDRFDETWLVLGGRLGQPLKLKYAVKEHLAARSRREAQP
jgi:CelD/BcsL family acetyltransferase involved in cellulose biosynthesis